MRILMSEKEKKLKNDEFAWANNFVRQYFDCDLDLKQAYKEENKKLIQNKNQTLNSFKKFENLAEGNKISDSKIVNIINYIVNKKQVESSFRKTIKQQIKVHTIKTIMQADKEMNFKQIENEVLVFVDKTLDKINLSTMGEEEIINEEKDDLIMQNNFEKGAFEKETTEENAIDIEDKQFPSELDNINDANSTQFNDYGIDDGDYLDSPEFVDFS